MYIDREGNLQPDIRDLDGRKRKMIEEDIREQMTYLELKKRINEFLEKEEAEKREKDIRKHLYFYQPTTDGIDIINDVVKDISKQILDLYHRYYYLSRRESEMLGLSSVGYLNNNMHQIRKQIDAMFEEEEEK